MKNMLQKSLSQLSKKRLQTIRRSLIISVPAVLCTAVMISPTIPLVTKGFKALSNIANSVVGIPFESSFEADETPVAKSDICTDVVGFSELSTKISDKGPTKATMSGSSLQGEGFNIADEVGFTGLKTFKYQGNVAEIARNSQKRFTATIFGTDQLIGNNTVQVADDFSLSYKIFPSLGTDGANPHKADNNYASSYVSLDLLYNDSATDTDNLLKLSNLGLKDQYGYGITPREQGNAKVLYSAQWNSKEIDLSAIKGKYIHAILLTYDYDGPSNDSISGYVDDIKIATKHKIDNTHLTNYVDTRRGTNSSSEFSRGNNIPATALPNGFNFYTPMTDSRSDWLYSYKAQVNDQNLPTLNGIGISHEPSPWMGDREQFNIMPSIASTIDPSPTARALPFKHENEIAQPDYYSVSFENGIKTEIAPASHSAIFRITFPSDQNAGTIIFDSRRGDVSSYEFKFDTSNNTLAGYVDNKSGMSAGASKMYLYAKFSQSFTNVSGNEYIIFDKSVNKEPVLMNIGSSYISEAQAQKNLSLEIGETSFEQLRNQATQKWEERLKVIDLSNSNASDVQKQTMYSNLYRLNLYPNEYFENTGTNSHPIYQYRSPVVNGNPIKDGKMYVNNGFWDTYRTVWPAYSLLYPKFIQELVDGFLYQYTDSGYVARWSSPGHADSMTGTSSDAAFSDAYVSGAVTDLNTALNIYNSGMADAFRYSGDKNLGRKGLNYSAFLGYTPYIDPAPQDYSNETVSWTLEGYINDYALSQMIFKLVKDEKLTDQLAIQKTGETKQQMLDNANYLLRRSENFSVLFDQDNKFFRAKDLAGNFVLHDGQPFDPLVWGNEFTETDGWNYAFSVPFDVPGLAYLYGSQNALIDKLDQFFNTPELATHRGSYWTEIHEMIEARDVRMGQLGMSNQPSHHIPYMYAAAGKPYKTQALTREILQRLYVGSDIGQGYCGDEDNGEMSAWYILSSLGIYDLALGSGKYIMTSPLFNKVTLTRDNGEKLIINATNNSEQNKYINSVTVDGKQQNDVYIDQSQLLSGNHTLSFDMSPVPFSWGERDIKPTKPDTIIDATAKGTLTSSDGTDVALLTNNNSNDVVNFNSSNVNLYWKRQSELGDSDTLIINMLTLTSAVENQKFNTIKILGSDNGDKWSTLAVYANQNFRYANQTHQFSFNANKNYQIYQIQLSMNTNVSLAELQLLESDYQPYINSYDELLWFAVASTIAMTIAGIIVLSTTLPTIRRNTKRWKQILKVQKKIVKSDHII